MSQVSLISASLASLSVEAFLYGICFILFCGSTYLMIARQRQLERGSVRGLVRDPLFIAAILFFLSITAHWILNVYRSFMAFVNFHDGAIPLIYYGNLQFGSEVGKSALLVFVVTVGDLVLIYRVWMVWDRNIWITIIPFTSFLAGLTCGIGVVIAQSHFNFLVPIGQSSMNTWIAGSCISDLCTNLICCGLIVWRLWQLSSARSLRLLWVFSVFVESAALYVGWNILYVATYEAGSNVEFTVVDAWVPIAGISFMLINVRVGLGYVLKPSSALSDLSWTPASRTTGYHENTVGSTPLSAVVNVTRRVEHEYNSDYGTEGTKYPPIRPYDNSEAV